MPCSPVVSALVARLARPKGFNKKVAVKPQHEIWGGSLAYKGFDGQSVYQILARQLRNGKPFQRQMHNLEPFTLWFAIDQKESILSPNKKNTENSSSSNVLSLKIGLCYVSRIFISLNWSRDF